MNPYLWLKQTASRFLKLREAKSLRDGATENGMMGTVVRLDGGKTARVFQKRNVLTLRSYAEYSVWVRAALDIYRQEVGRARGAVAPFEPAKKVDQRVKEDIEKLRDTPNPSETSYAEMKETFVEDYLVIGHGAIEKAIKRNGEPYELYQMDAARLAFVQGWDGKQSKPRYAEMSPDGTKIIRFIPDAMAMVMVNRPRSYDLLGLSHVEVLDKTIRALLEGDDFLLNQIMNPTPNGVLDLGKGVPATVVRSIRMQLEHVRRALLVIGNSEGSKFVSLQQTQEAMRQLDNQIWFVREVAAVFQIPMSKLQVQVDQSRSNTQAQFEEMHRGGTTAMLERLRDLENTSITKKFGPILKHNCVITYPGLEWRDKYQQARTAALELGGQAYESINGARRSAGKDPLSVQEHPGAEEIWIKTKEGPVPLSVLELQFYDGLKPIAQPRPATEPATEPEEEEPQTVN